MDAKKRKKSSAFPTAIDLKSSSSSIDYAISTSAVSIQGIASFVPLAEAAGICIVVPYRRRFYDAPRMPTTSTTASSSVCHLEIQHPRCHHTCS